MKNKSNSSKKLFVQRLLAYMIDCCIIVMVVSFICAPFLDYDSIKNLSGSSTQVLVDFDKGNIDAEACISSLRSILYRLSKKEGLIALTTIFLNILYFVVYQFKNKGQTIGKKLLGIKVVSNDSRDLTMDNYIYRSFIINSVLIDMIIFAFVIFANESAWFTATSVFGTIRYVLLLSCGLRVIFSKEERGLHDLVGNTKVIKI